MQEDKFNMVLAMAEMWICQSVIADNGYMNYVGFEGVNFNPSINEDN